MLSRETERKLREKLVDDLDSYKKPRKSTELGGAAIVMFTIALVGTLVAIAFCN